MTLRKDAEVTLCDLVDDVGVPKLLMTDGATKLTGPNTYCWMKRKGVPRKLWDLMLIYKSEILLQMSRERNGRSGYEKATGNTLDTSQLLDFEFYALVWWWDDTTKHVTEVERVDSETIKEIESFNKHHSGHLDDTSFSIKHNGYLIGMDPKHIGASINGSVKVARDEKSCPGDDKYGDLVADDRAKDDLEEAIDQQLSAKLILGLGTDNEQLRRVLKHSRDPDGQAVGEHIGTCCLTC
eukprot:4339237-Ditylum_brightwellii.AAC.1